MSDDTPVRGGIQSLEKGAAILRALETAGRPLRLTELAAQVGMSRSQAHGYLVSLIRTGLVAQDQASGLYDLGEAALQLGLVALSRLDFLKLARGAMSGLSERLGETVTLSVWSGQGAVVVDKIEGGRDSVYEIRIGSTVRLWPTATGRVFMAFLPQAVWEPVLLELLARSGLGPDAVTGLPDELAAVREHGAAATLPATMPDFSAVAVPVFDHQAGLKGVITVIGRVEALDIDPCGGPVRQAKQAAAQLSTRLGYRGG